MCDRLGGCAVFGFPVGLVTEVLADLEKKFRDVWALVPVTRGWMLGQFVILHWFASRIAWHIHSC